MGAYLIWSIVLFIAGALIAVLETILPSGGLLAVASLASLGGSLYCAYQLSGVAMAVVAALEAIIIPTAVVLTFKWLPRTKMGRDLMLSPAKRTSAHESGIAGLASDESAPLIGATGRAATMLRPSGTAEIGGKRVSVVTNGEMLTEGTTLKVVHVEGNRVVVEAVR